MTRFAFLDYWYPEAWDAWQVQGGPPLHGTADYWDVALRAAGHESETFVRNSFSTITEMLNAARAHTPDIIVSEDVARFTSSQLRYEFPAAKLVAFCSHRADDSALLGWDAVLSSFKWMPDHCASIGVRCEYLPLAFGRPVLDRVPPAKERDIPVCFIGGLGSRIWDQGTKTMAAIAEAIPEFRWWGYFACEMRELPESLRRTYQGQAWGVDMYRILARTDICLNRHGEIARGWANNMRSFEAGGMRCKLLSDCRGVVNCAIYDSAEDAILKINWHRKYGNIGDCDAGRLQEDVLEFHTFEARVPAFMKAIESL